MHFPLYVNILLQVDFHSEVLIWFFTRNLILLINSICLLIPETPLDQLIANHLLHRLWFRDVRTTISYDPFWRGQWIVKEWKTVIDRRVNKMECPVRRLGMKWKANLNWYKTKKIPKSELFYDGRLWQLGRSTPVQGQNQFTWLLRNAFSILTAAMHPLLRQSETK